MMLKAYTATPLCSLLASSKTLGRVTRRLFLTASFPEIDQFNAKLPPERKIKNYQDLHKFSIEQNEEFWSTLAKTRLQWFKPFNQVRSGDFHDEYFRLEWFLDGKLNASVNCVDRHYVKNPQKVALIWEKDEPNQTEYVTYEQLYKTMNQVANMLKAHGVGKGDRVAIYMPTCAMIAPVLMACTRIGAVHSVVFAGFSAESLASRINDSQCKVVITANQGMRGGKAIDLKKTVDDAMAKGCPSVDHVFVYNRTDNQTSLGPKDILMDDKKLSQYSTECQPEHMDSEDPLFILYTSGSTGRPKGLVHTTAGYLLQTAVSHQLVFNYNANTDVFGCMTDVGWITGHSYLIYAPLCNGGTTVLFESTPNYPNPGRYWDAVQRFKINQLYMAPTAIRLLMKYGDDWVTRYDRSSLKVLGSVGEPINNEAWQWYYETVGEKRCKIADTWWQTETGGQMITPMPCGKDDPIKPGMAMRPFLGIDAVLLDDRGKPLEPTNSRGVLCIRKPWPSMARTIYGDHKRYLETYVKPFAGYYFTGDGAQADHDGHLQIVGRVDDVINVSGHRIGTAEIEDVVNSHIAIAESAVVGYEHTLYGEGIYAFMVLKKTVQEDSDQIIGEIKNLVKKNIASYAVPHRLLIVKHLPKTRSGKIMRRILRKIAENKFGELGDLSTLAEPEVVDEVIKSHKKSKGQK